MDIIQNMFRSIDDHLNVIIKSLNIQYLRCGFSNFIEFACQISLISTIYKALLLYCTGTLIKTQTSRHSVQLNDIR